MKPFTPAAVPRHRLEPVHADVLSGQTILDHRGRAVVNIGVWPKGAMHHVQPQTRGQCISVISGVTLVIMGDPGLPVTYTISNPQRG